MMPPTAASPATRKPAKIYVLILAGGSGERFWPLSRRDRPKQLLQLFSKQTLLEDTLSRLDGLVPKEQILILTNKDQEQSVRALCPELPADNIVAEPEKRDTAAAIALGAAWICVRDPFATMVVLPADHLIKDRKAFQRDLRAAALMAQESGDLITVGIKPSWACPGFGYIEMGKPLQAKTADKSAFHEVTRFREKPNAELAEGFLKQGNFRWNAGIFVWAVPSIITEFNRHAPALAGFVAQVHESKDLKATLETCFRKLPKISIDYAIMEKARRVLVLEATFDWDDVGSWTAVAKYLEKDESGNASNSPVAVLESRDNIVFTASGKQVALVGVRDLIVVETEDAILVSSVHRSEKIKSIIPGLLAQLQ